MYTRFCSLIKPQPYFRDPLRTFEYHPSRFKISGTVFFYRYRLNLWLFIWKLNAYALWESMRPRSFGLKGKRIVIDNKKIPPFLLLVLYFT